MRRQLLLFLCGVFMTLCAVFTGCTDNINMGMEETEVYYTVTEDCGTKGVTGIISGVGTYKTGQSIVIKAKSGAQITGVRTKGSGSFGSTYQSGGYACANINDIHGDWKVTAMIPDYAVTVKAGSGGTASGGGTVEKGSSTNISATPSSGYSFKGWSLISGTGILGNASSSSTSFEPTSDATVTAEFKKNEVVPTIIFTISYKSAMNDPQWINYIEISARSNVALASTLKCTLSYNCTSYTQQGEAVSSGLTDVMADALISKGGTSGSKLVYGCGYNPTNLKITSVTIHSPAGFKAVY